MSTNKRTSMFFVIINFKKLWYKKILLFGCGSEKEHITDTITKDN